MSPILILPSALSLLAAGCAATAEDVPVVVEASAPVVVTVAPGSAVANSAGLALSAEAPAVGTGAESGWLEYEIEIPVCGRYRSTLLVEVEGGGERTVWLEDHVGNPDGRTYDITGPIPVGAPTQGPIEVGRDGAPLDAMTHRLRVHHAGGRVTLHGIRFELMRRHLPTPTTHVQRTEGDGEWVLAWSDEFDGEGLPDPAHWTHDVGDWGWGNREPQYYTEARTANARQEDGCLVIEARRGDLGKPWTSARLTTRGKRSFLYGRLEIRAKAPVGDGAWAAGWLLGDDYRDERSWPYCGEVDVLEAVGREVDDTSGDGINHGSCHTRAYYFKQGNHISRTIPVQGMGTGFHEYAMEWDRDEVRMYVDGEHYYTYDKTADEFEWPFARPQNLILNLAMGGGMGGEIDPELTSQRLVVDYVRVFGRR